MCHREPNHSYGARLLHHPSPTQNSGHAVVAVCTTHFFNITSSEFCKFWRPHGYAVDQSRLVMCTAVPTGKQLHFARPPWSDIPEGTPIHSPDTLRTRCIYVLCAIRSTNDGYVSRTRPSIGGRPSLLWGENCGGNVVHTKITRQSIKQHDKLVS